MIAAAILPIAQMLYGGFQQIKANQELKKLAKQDISYKATPNSNYLLGLSRDNINHGYTAAEKAAFMQTVAGNTAKAYRVGMGRAGNSLSSVIGASNNIANSQAMNQFAAQDANQQRANQQIYAGQVAQEQSRANQNTAMEFQQNNMAQRAWGQAGQNGVNNIMSGLQMGSMLMRKPDTQDPNAGYNVTNPGDMNMQLPQNPYGEWYNNPVPQIQNNFAGQRVQQLQQQGKSPYGAIDWNNLPNLY